MVKTAVLVSGGGTNLQALIDAHGRGEIKNCELRAVISSNPEAYALERGKKAGIPVFVVDKSAYPERCGYSDAILCKLKELEIELVVLAGFMWILDKNVARAYENAMINIHPALIPSFCGEGAYGMKVHEMAIDHGVKLSGATAHFVIEDTDMGPIIAQKAVEVREDDSPEVLQRRIMEQAEWKLLPQAVSLFCEGRLSVEGRKVRIATK